MYKRQVSEPDYQALFLALSSHSKFSGTLISWLFPGAQVDPDGNLTPSAEYIVLYDWAPSVRRQYLKYLHICDLSDHIFSFVHLLGTQDPEELRLEKGQSLVILEPQDEGGQWCLGQCLETGAKGIFPLNYVRPKSETIVESPIQKTEPTPASSAVQYSETSTDSLTSTRSTQSHGSNR